MLFDQVAKEYILLGIKNYQENGLPNRFGPSSTSDLVFNDKAYHPIAVMTYVNFHAVRRKMERYFEEGF